MRIYPSLLLACGQVFLSSQWVSAAAASAPTGADTFNRHFNAVGGRAALQKIQTVVVKGTGEEKGKSFDLEFYLKIPGQILMVAHTAEGLSVRQGRDGRAQCWREDAQGVRALTDTEAGELMGLTGGFFYPAQLFWSRMLSNAPCRSERDGDQELMAVGQENSPFPKVFFNQATGQLVRIGQDRFEDYRPVDAIQFPFLATDAGQFRVRAKEIQCNVAINDSVFDNPAGKTASASAKNDPPRSQYATLQSGAGQLEITRHPQPCLAGREHLTTLPVFRPNSAQPFQVDLRGKDASDLDLKPRLADLWHADFDDQTRWPSSLPPEFNIQKIVTLGKDPGLGVRQLHTRGITGQGIGVGIIDQPLLVDHIEYADRLRLYEEIHSAKNSPAQMHGPAVASIAAGKTLGVAPAADLYYIAEMHGTMAPGGQFDWDFTWLAKSIHRLLDVNGTLPANKKIRVISISVGWSPEQKGCAQAMAAVERASQQGVFVVSTAIEQTHHLAFHGLGRDPLADPNLAGSFGPGSWWASSFWGGYRRFKPGERLLVPMDGRTTASPTGANEYVFYSSSGWSWAVPWISGLYALACQVNPGITPDQFWTAALKTGKTIRLQHQAEEIDFGTIADPIRLIQELEAAKAR